MAKVKLKRKGFMDVTELEALQKCYGQGFKASDYKKYLVAPVIFTASFSLMLFHSIIFTIICGLLGAIYGFKIIMPRSVQREYQLKSLHMRNRFINSLTQILTDDQKITLGAIELANSRTSGELHDDMSILQARLEGADRKQVAYAFDELRNKYERDVLFSQYLEQIETALVEGREGDIETIKSQKTYHNDTVKNTEDFLKVKEEHYKGNKLIVALIAGMVLVITFSFEFETYHQAFANTFIGNIFGGIFYGILLLLMHKFFKIYFDDEVMSVGKYKSSKEKDVEVVKNNFTKVNFFAKKTKKLWLSLLGENNYELLSEMGNRDAIIINWAFKMFMVIFTILFMSVFGAVLFSQMIVLMVGAVLSIVYYVVKIQHIKALYMQYQFERQLEFAKFSRLVIPHLKAKGVSNLHSVFEKVLARIEREEDRIHLLSLMEDMTNRPDDLEPFIEYANKMSKTDKAVLFMNTIYDIKQGSADLSVIEEMDKLMSQDLMDSIGQIITYKEKKFSLFSTKLTMTVIIFFLGVVVTFLIHELASSGFVDVLGGG